MLVVLEAESVIDITVFLEYLDELVRAGEHPVEHPYVPVVHDLVGRAVEKCGRSRSLRIFRHPLAGQDRPRERHHSGVTESFGQSLRGFPVAQHPLGLKNGHRTG